MPGSSCCWSLSALKRPPPAPRLPAEVPAPDSERPALCRGTGQDLPSSLPANSRGHSGTPGGAGTSPTFPGEPGQVVGRALRLSAPLDVPAA